MPMVNGKKYPYTKAGKKEAALAAAKDKVGKMDGNKKPPVNSSLQSGIKSAILKAKAASKASEALGRYKEQDKRFGNPNIKPMKPTKKSSRKPTMKRTRPTGKR
jgi:hypothetical protein